MTPGDQPAVNGAALIFGIRSVYSPSVPHDRRPGVTRRHVDEWLAELARQIRSILGGPAGEMKARLSIVERKIERWRERLKNDR